MFVLPNLPVASAPNGVPSQQSPAQYLAANPPTQSTGTVTVGGTVTNNDTLTVTFTSTLFKSGSVSVTITAGAADTVDTLADALAAAISNKSSLNAIGVYATAAAAVVTVHAPDEVGNQLTLSKSLSGGATETLTLVQMASGTAPIVPTDDFQFINNGVPILFRRGVPVQASVDLLKALIAAGAPIE